MKTNIIRIPCMPKDRKSSATLSDLIESWEAHAYPRLKQSTASIYSGILHAHIQPAFGQMPPEELSAAIIEAFLAEKSKTLAPSTVANISTVLHSLLEHGQTTGFFSRTITWTCHSGMSGKTAEVLQSCEKKRLVEHLIYNIHSGAQVDESFSLLLCLYTGMRLGEICALRWEDISPKGAITIRRTIQRISDPTTVGHTKIIFDTPKSQSSNRIIPMPLFLRKQMGSIRKSDNCFVLTGTPDYVEPRTMQNHFKATLKKCGIRPVNFHTLRHTFATDCVSAGFDPKTLSAILGHADVSITLNTYVHPSFDVKRRFMDKLSPGI